MQSKPAHEQKNCQLNSRKKTRVSVNKLSLIRFTLGTEFALLSMNFKQALNLLPVMDHPKLSLFVLISCAALKHAGIFQYCRVVSFPVVNQCRQI